jgi:serine/threonine protein kinase
LIGYDPAQKVLVLAHLPHRTLDDVNFLVYDGETPPQWDATARSKAVVGIVAGMALAHSLGLYHRDLTPSSIFVDRQWEIRITDFNRPANDEREQAAGMDIPTQAPETYTSEQPARPAPADAYALWARLERLDDTVDWRRSSRAMLIRRICESARFARDDSIPRYYWELITRCWAQDREARSLFAVILKELLKSLFPTF